MEVLLWMILKAFAILVALVFVFHYVILWLFMSGDYYFLKQNYSWKQLLGIAFIIPATNAVLTFLPGGSKARLLFIEKIVRKLVRKIYGKDMEDGSDLCGACDNSDERVMRECTKEHPFSGERKENEVWTHVDTCPLDEDGEGRFFKCPNCGVIIDLGPDV